MRNIDRIVVHYTASNDVPMRTVSRWHRDRGFGTMGYHKLIRKDGTVETARPDSQQGVHIKGYNVGSLGVCLTGADDLDWYPSAAQQDSLVAILSQWQSLYGIPTNRIYWHKELGATSCPGRLSKTAIIKRLEEGDNDMGTVSQKEKDQIYATLDSLIRDKDSLRKDVNIHSKQIESVMLKTLPKLDRVVQNLTQTVKNLPKNIKEVVTLKKDVSGIKVLIDKIKNIFTK